MLPLRSAVYAVDLLLAEVVPVDSSFAFVDEVEIDQRVEFAHLVETVVAAASADVVDLVAASLTFASGVAFVMDFDSSASVGVAVAH
mmetsp:Transcript_32067/g.54704  ORF Transcript_32067/g.54704 Transcript_32067/m.54704 type:complete len:87 (-) Transcript_32067:822-1082(-)